MQTSRKPATRTRRDCRVPSPPGGSDQGPETRRDCGAGTGARWGTSEYQTSAEGYPGKVPLQGRHIGHAYLPSVISVAKRPRQPPSRRIPRGLQTSTGPPDGYNISPSEVPSDCTGRLFLVQESAPHIFCVSAHAPGPPA